jgi:L-aspartate oxidase
LKYADVIIVGSGIAALQLAVNLSTRFNVIVLTKSKLRNGNSYLAQGGIAVPLAPSDSPYKHFIDTLEAGNHHHDEEAVLDMTTDAPEIFSELYTNGCSFDKDSEGNLLLGLEGAHREKRIVHCGGDATGKEVVESLITRLSGNVTLYEDTFVYELLMKKSQKKCIGLKAHVSDGSLEYFFASHVVLATGGCGQLYNFTSNAKQALGDGLALAYIAGAEMTDMEFIQFHPTLLYADGKVQGLISEAVRGEGGRLVTDEGVYIMDDIHPLKDLAPRHIVSQTIFEYLRSGKNVFLNVSSIANFKGKFPTITRMCENAEIDLQQGLIPVAPGSHFLMGGVRVDKIGRTTVEGLYAIGEMACTGIHGANRLASNSLLEGLYYGKKLGKWLNQQYSPDNHPSPLVIKRETNKVNKISLPKLELLQRRMMNKVGIIRTKELLEEQKIWLEGFQFLNYLDSNLDEMSIQEKQNLFAVLVAWMITHSALERTESRGGHFRTDFPEEDNVNWKKRKIIVKRNMEGEISNEQIETAFAT